MWGVVGVLLFLGVGVVLGEDFSLVILHNNDMHARFEETERNSGTCKESHRNVSCIGGFARTAHEIRRYRQMAKEGKIPDVLYLNAGDTYVGTSWFSVFTWNISAEFINALRPDAMSLGNHEFDKGVDGLVPFVNAVNSPIVAANLDFSQEPSLNSIEKSVVLNVSGRKVGVIGYLTPDTKQISAPEKTIFLDEIAAIRDESEKLDKEGVKIIIALGHSGYAIDQKIAKEVELVDVVVGGHTNTFLWNGNQPDMEKVEDPYPKVITRPDGKQVPVVQAYAYTKYLGRLNVTFNESGDLIRFHGQPELLDSSVPQEPDVLNLLESYRPAIVELNKQIVGSSKVILDGDSAKCRFEECNFGNLITDAFVAYVASVSPEHWTTAPIGFYNGGGIRNTVNPFDSDGKVTRGELLGAIPFGSQIVTLKLNGSNLIRALEQGVRGNGETSAGEFLQVSGLKVVYDRSKPSGSRVVTARARCGLCEIPTYEEVKPEEEYSIVTTSFLVNGGDEHTVIQNDGWDYKIQDFNDLDTVEWYFRKYSPVYPEVQDRIMFVNSTNENLAMGYHIKERNNGVKLQCCSSFVLIVLTVFSVRLS